MQEEDFPSPQEEQFTTPREEQFPTLREEQFPTPREEHFPTPREEQFPTPREEQFPTLREEFPNRIIPVRDILPLTLSGKTYFYTYFSFIFLSVVALHDRLTGLAIHEDFNE